MKIGAGILAVILLAIPGCGDSGGGSTLTPSSRGRFLGTWKGQYHGLDDEMILEAGSSDYEVNITLHARIAGDTEAFDKVVGKLVAADRIEIPEQKLRGGVGRATITLKNGKLQLKQSGGGVTVKGKDYVKQ